MECTTSASGKLFGGNWCNCLQVAIGEGWGKCSRSQIFATTHCYYYYSNLLQTINWSAGTFGRCTNASVGTVCVPFDWIRSLSFRCLLPYLAMTCGSLDLQISSID